MFKHIFKIITNFKFPSFPKIIKFDRILSINEKLARTAEQEWERNIKEIPGVINEHITEMFEQNNWGSWLRSDTGGKCPNGYIRPPDPDWCGQALANHALKMNPPVKSDIAKIVFPSTFRLARKWNFLHLKTPLVPKSSLKRGDIVVFRWEGGKKYGDHIAVATSNPDKSGEFNTIEGNAKGHFPDGEYGHGLVKQTRNLSQVARVYRLNKNHLQS